MLHVLSADRVRLADSGLAGRRPCCGASGNPRLVRGGGRFRVVCRGEHGREAPIIPGMHRSRVSTFLIDTPHAKASEAAEFWSSALGVSFHSPPGEPQYMTLEDGIPGYALAVQSIDADPRYHLDIETDDVDAEVTRLVALGATQVSSWLECRSLRAPGGHLLCVIPVHSDPEYFAQNARAWP